jgi:peroxiredoxin Q/BCP
LARFGDEYTLFTGRGAQVLAIGPDGKRAFEQFWAEHRLPCIGLPDPDHAVARRYKQEVNLFKWGRMPLVLVVDAHGLIRYVHYGASMSDIPSNEILLGVIDELNAASE